MVPTDTLDEAIIAKLQIDGRASNRQIGRELNVSEGTIRKRLKRLHDLNCIRLSVIVDREVAGLRASAYVRLAVAPRLASDVALSIAKLDACGYAAFTAGRYNVLCFLLAEDRARLAKIIDEHIVSRPGVHEADVREIVSTFKHRFDLVRII